MKIDIKSRVAVQRKNLIYAPIFKELLKLKKYVEENRGTCYINIIEQENEEGWYNDYYFNGKRIESGKFLLWHKIKNDIRRVYVPSKIANAMKNISINLIAYNKEKEAIKSEFKSIVEKEIKPLYSEGHNLGDLQLPPSFFSKGDYSFNEADLKEIHGVINDEGFEEIRKKCIEVCSNLEVHISRKNFFYTYDKLINSVNLANNEVNKLIKFILNKYEYGKELEEYN